MSGTNALCSIRLRVLAAFDLWKPTHHNNRTGVDLSEVCNCTACTRLVAKLRFACRVPSLPPVPETSMPDRRQDALLIDLIDFGAEETFQMPVTPRSGPSTPGSSRGTSQHSIFAGNSTSQLPVGAVNSAVLTARTAMPGSMALLPPPPQVSCSLCWKIHAHHTVITGADACCNLRN